MTVTTLRYERLPELDYPMAHLLGYRIFGFVPRLGREVSMDWRFSPRFFDDIRARDKVARGWLENFNGNGAG